jgi:hypothetical protein
MEHTALPFSATVFAFCLLTTGPVGGADELAARTDRSVAAPDQLQLLTDDMSPQDYRKAYRRNRRLIRKAATAYSKDSLRSMGVPKTAVNLVGVAARLAVDQNVKFAVGGSRIMAVELRDVAAEYRAIVFGVRLRW